MSGMVKAIGGMFNSAPPPPAPLPAAPSSANTQTQADLNAAAQQQASSMQRGTAAILTNSGGAAGLNNLGQTSKVLLGQ